MLADDAKDNSPQSTRPPLTPGSSWAFGRRPRIGLPLVLFAHADDAYGAPPCCPRSGSAHLIIPTLTMVAARGPPRSFARSWSNFAKYGFPV